jgi:hypothetical protein
MRIPSLVRNVSRTTGGGLVMADRGGVSPDSATSETASDSADLSGR